MPVELPLPSGAEYIRAKAAHYLRVGPAAYRAEDALGRPGPDVPHNVLALVHLGFEQIVAGRGFAASEPLEGVGIHGLYVLMSIVHFERVSQSATFRGKTILDKISFRHVASGWEIVVFNLVPQPDVNLARPRGGALRSQKNRPEE